MILKEMDFEVLILVDFLMFCRVRHVALACRLVRHELVVQARLYG